MRIAPEGWPFILAFWALELVRDKETREPLVPFNAAGDANAPMLKLMASLGFHVAPYAEDPDFRIATKAL